MLGLLVLLQGLAAGNCWQKVRDERMPGELRFANEGLSHDDTYWYLTNKHFIYQVNQTPMTIAKSNHKAIPEELTQQGYDHIGDIEVMNGIIYGGIEGGPTGILARWNTSTLEIIDYKTITEQNGVPWVTVNPTTSLLYTSNWNVIDSINVYDTNTFTYVDTLSIQNPTDYPKEVQGASFYKDELYLATNVKDGIFKVNIATGIVELVFQDDDNYVIDNYYYEMEGKI